MTSSPPWAGGRGSHGHDKRSCPVEVVMGAFKRAVEPGVGFSSQSFPTKTAEEVPRLSPLSSLTGPHDSSLFPRAFPTEVKGWLFKRCVGDWWSVVTDAFLSWDEVVCIGERLSLTPTEGLTQTASPTHTYLPIGIA
jgi:hypothetical protein